MKPFACPIRLLLFFAFGFGVVHLQNAQSRDSVLYTKQIRQAYLAIVNLAPENPDSAYVLAKVLINEARSDNYPQLASGYFGLAEAYFYMQAYDSARVGYEKALEGYKQIGDSARMAASFNNIGLLHYYQSNYKKALDAYEASLDLEKQLKNPMGMAQCHQNIGIIYANWKLPSSAMNHYQSAMEIYESLGKVASLAELANNIGVIQVKLSHYKEALQSYKKSYQSFKSIDDQRGLASVTSNLGQLFLKRKQFDRALAYFDEAMAYFESTNDRLRIIHTYSSVGDAFYEMGQAEKALEYYFKAELINRDIGNKNLQKDNLFDIYEAYTRLKDYEKANRALVEYYELKDSIFSEDKFNKLVELEKKYQTEKSQKELIALKAKDQRRQLIVWALWIILILMSVIVYVIFRIQRMKYRQRRVLLEQKILRTQMNPHFIFNSLSALQCMILDEKADEAVDFVAEFSGLMRLVLQYSKEETISLKKEEEILDYYMRLQNRRFSNKVNYKIEIDSSLQVDRVLVPPMLVQPFVENAIEHGELSQKEGGEIKVSFARQNNNLELVIEDNGIGVLSARSKKRHSAHKSMAMEITRERLRLLYNNASDKRFDLELEDLSASGQSGTRVKFHIPYQELN